MGELETGGFDAQQKLKVMRNMLPVYRQHLIPSKIVPYLAQLLGGLGDARREILELEENGKRVEAAERLMKIVLKKGEKGLSLFIHALQGDGDTQRWDRFLTPLENSSSDDNLQANQYFAFILGLLEGEIINHLTEGEILHILSHLYATDVIDDIDFDTIKNTLSRKGRYYAAIQMFTQMSTYTDDWPRQFLLAVREVKPSLVRKIDPLGEDPVSKSGESCQKGRLYYTREMLLQWNTTTTSSDLFSDLFTPEMFQKPKNTAVKTSAGHRGDKEAAAASGKISARTRQVKDPDADEQTIRKEPVRSRKESVQPHRSSEETKAIRVLGDPRLDDPASHDETVAAGPSADGDISDDSSDDGDFSDTEKNDYEESEKHQKPARPKHDHQPRDLALRSYQEELAAPALKGQNTIICAPTGSGKTRVALHIVQKHLQARPDGNKKVVFLARTGPLVAQQYKNFTKYLPEFPAVLVTGESEHSQNLHGLMDNYRILVLTPKILENHLTPDKIPSLSVFSLIIFDECHHTRKGEPYNSVMKNYLKSKKRGETELPQIVGLTASIGVEKATTVEKAKASILGVMGNLDVRCLSVVKEYKEELQRTVPRPDELLLGLTPRDGDEISNKICNIMARLEELLGKSESQMQDPEIEEVRRILAKRPGDRREQKYGQWAVSLRQQARLLKKPVTSTPKSRGEAEKIEKRIKFSHEVQILADALIAYNEALDVHDLTRPQDVLDYLRQKFRLQCMYKPPEVETTVLEEIVLEFFKDLEKKLEKLATPNPNLDILATTILQHLADKEEEQSHIIIFVRTRATCLALCNWLNSTDVDETLSDLKASPFTGSGAHQDQGGMTQNQQESVIEKFRSGDIKLIVSTSVGEEGIDIPECNLTIKYNHVGNEVTTVQTRGRSRKQGGLSILLAMPRIILQEQVNRQREGYMNKAIEYISSMREKEITKKVEEVQKKTMEAEEIEEVVRKAKKLKSKQRGKFSLVCCQCYKLRVDGSKIRKVQDAHHVILGHDIDKMVTIHQGSNPRNFDEMEFRGSVICKCKNRLGQLLIYKGIQFKTLGLKYWVVLDKDDNPMTYKRWKDLPYAIEELSADDIREHLPDVPDSASSSSEEEEEEEEGAVGGADGDPE